MYAGLIMFLHFFCFFFSSRRRHTRCALVTGVQTCALPISFELVSDYQPAGDQPAAIRELVDTARAGERDQVLLGVTGPGKTFTMAKEIGRASCRERVCQSV